MNKQDIIQTAIKLEQDGRQFYLDVSKKTVNPVVKNVFTQLAQDELDHITWIEKNLGPKDNASDLNRQTYQKIKHVFKDVPEETRGKALAADDEIEPLRVALQFEAKAAKAYAKWAEDADDPVVRDICGKLAEVEKFHEELIDNTILYLENPSEYFQREEDWTLDGG